jgi:hypothetical protein
LRPAGLVGAVTNLYEGAASKRSKKRQRWCKADFLIERKIQTTGSFIESTGEIMRRLLQTGCFLLLGTVIVVMIQAASRAAESSTNQSGVQTRPKDNPIPNTFVNLQVLSKDISKRDLVGIMKQFSTTFNVRCSYCHSVSDDLTEGSFDSEEKPQKQKARELMKSIIENGKPRASLLPAAAGRNEVGRP